MCVLEKRPKDLVEAPVIVVGALPRTCSSGMRDKYLTGVNAAHRTREKGRGQNRRCRDSIFRRVTSARPSPSRP